MSPRKPRPWPDAPKPLAAPVVDNHTHLPTHVGEIPRREGVALSLEDQLDRARQVGVTAFISSACELPDFDPMIELARAHEGVRVAIAIHPNDAALHAGCADPSPDGLVPVVRDYHVPLDEALAAVEARLDDPMVVAVGESGLDYFRTADPGREAQKESFRAHIEMAQRVGLPLQIHDRDAHEDTLEILRECASSIIGSKSGSSQALEIMRVTPTSRARSSCSSRLSATPSRLGISPRWVGRCVWLSTTGAARGAGASGQGRGLRELMREQ